MPSPVLSAASSSLSESSDDTEKTLPPFTPQTPTTPRTPHTPRTPTSLSPIPASPTSPTSFSSGPQHTQGPPTGRVNKNRTSRTETSQFSALSGSVPGELGVPPVQTPRKSAGSPISPVSPASDCTVSVASSTLVRPVPRRAYTAPAKEPDLPSASWSLTRRESSGDGEPVARTKTSRSFDEKRSTRLAIAADAWVDGAVPEEPEIKSTAPALPTLGYRTVPLPPSTPTPKARPSVQHHRSHSFSDTQPGPQTQTPASVKYVNPYSQIREQDEPRPVATAEESRQHTRRSSSDRSVQRTRGPPALSVKSTSMPTVPQHGEDVLGLAIGGTRPPPASRPTPTHRASVHGYPYGSGRPPSPTPQAFSRVYPSPLSPNTPLPQQQTRPTMPLSSKDANVRGSTGAGAGYTLGVGGGLGVPSGDRKPRSAVEMKPASPNPPPLVAPLARPKNSKMGRQ